MHLQLLNFLTRQVGNQVVFVYFKEIFLTEIINKYYLNLSSPLDKWCLLNESRTNNSDFFLTFSVMTISTIWIENMKTTYKAVTVIVFHVMLAHHLMLYKNNYTKFYTDILFTEIWGKSEKQNQRLSIVFIHKWRCITIASCI